MKCVAVILSGGTGSRMNMDIPKQYIKAGGCMVITDSMRAFWECDMVNDIQIVSSDIWRNDIIDEYKKYMSGTLHKLRGFSAPGENRQLSILNALRDIKSDTSEDDIIIIHDAARPFVTVEMLKSYITAIGYGNDNKGIKHDGVMPVLPMKDTIYYSEDGSKVSELLDRDKLYAGQAPEVFRFGKYLSACERLLPDKILEIRGSTEPAILAGMDIVMTPGDEKNFKITTREDLDRYLELKTLLSVD